LQPPSVFILQLPKISIVTPSFNQAAYLEYTIQSVLDQKYPNLEYIIIDGGSTDGSVDVIKKYEKYLAYWISEKDKGLYFALQKGFEKTTGEVMGWLNSDDMLHKLSLFTLADIFLHLPQVQWVQGLQTIFDENGRTVYTTEPPLRSRYNYYLKDYKKSRAYVFIQQESTYWRRSLWEATGGFVSTQYSLAGDFELWMRFFQQADLYFTKALIGGFRIRKQGQLSTNNYQKYVMEADTIIDDLHLSSEELNKIRWIRLYRKYKKLIPGVRLNSVLARKYNHWLGPPKVVKFDYTTHSFKI
jgi:glycosyltransferase involved in cell wall biosynthesis